MSATDLTVGDLAHILETVIPPSWGKPGDSIGLQAGDPRDPVRRVHPVVWITTAVLAEAQERNVDLLITQRPLPEKLLQDNRALSPETRLLRRLFRTDLGVYCVASSIDLHPQGPSRILAEHLGLTNLRAALPKPQCGQVKIVTFVPTDRVDSIRTIMAEAGAGRIGEYELCSFRLSGEGSFRGSKRSKPFTGEAGRLEFSEEERLEMICPSKDVSRVIAALWDAHPYEELAYDVYVLQDFRDPRQALWIGEFRETVTWERFHEVVASAFPSVSGPERVTTMIPTDRASTVRRIACTATDGSAMVSHLSEMEVQGFICRGIDDHAAWELEERGILCLSLGRNVLHGLFSESVRRILDPWKEKIEIV